MAESKEVGERFQVKIPQELNKYGRVTIYAGNDKRKARLLKLLELGDGKSLSEMVDLAVIEYLRKKGVLTGDLE